VKFDGQDITEAQQLIDATHRAKIGQTIEISYWRGAEQQTIRIVLTETPKPQ
jgi:S1-C subfamily serine protease